MSHRDWNIRIHQNELEPLDDVVDALDQAIRPDQPGRRISRQDQGHLARRADRGRQPGQAVLLALRSLPAACRHRRARHLPGRRIEMGQGQNRQLELGHLSRLRAKAATRPASRSACRWARPSDAVDWVGALFNSYGVVMVDAKDNIKINSDETRQALEYLKKLMAVNPPEVYAWDDAGNNRWLISGKGSSIMNPPSAWAVAKRDNPRSAENCWTHPMPRGPKGRFVGQLPQFYGVWNFSKNKPAAKDLLLYISQKESIAQLVQASSGYDLPSFKTMYDLDDLEDGRAAGRHRLRLSAARRRADLDRRRAGALRSRRPDLQSGDQHRDGRQVHAGQREARRRDQVGRERARRHSARLSARSSDASEAACRHPAGPACAVNATGGSIRRDRRRRIWPIPSRHGRRAASRFRALGLRSPAAGTAACSCSCAGARPSRS